MPSPPVFLSSIRPETDATDGDIVTFQARVDGDPTPVVTWLRCGELLHDLASRRELISHGDGWHELIITNISEEDEGEYECRAENSLGNISCFGELYYYAEGRVGSTPTGTEEDGGRQSALLILIDDGSHTEEEEEDEGQRKSMTVSEQMQGIIEDLAHDTQEDNTVSGTLGKDDEFISDSDLRDDFLDHNYMEGVFFDAEEDNFPASQRTLVPDGIPPQDVFDVTKSDGACDPHLLGEPWQKWKSSPSAVSMSDPSVLYQPPTNIPSKRLSEDVATLLTRVDKKEIFGTCPPGEETLREISELSTHSADDCVSYHDDTSFRDFTIDDVAGSNPLWVQHHQGGHCDLSLIETQSDPVEFKRTPVSRLQEGECISAMSYSRSSVRSSSTSYRYKDDPTEEYSQSSVRSSSRVVSSSRFDHENTSASLARTSRSSLDDNGGSSIRRTSYTYKDDDDLSTSSYRRTSRSSLKDESESFSYKRSKLSYDVDESSASLRATERITAFDRRDSGSTLFSRTSALFSDTYITGAAEPKAREVYVAIMDFRPMESDEEAIPMKEGQEVEILDATKPRRWLVRTRPVNGSSNAEEGWVPSCYLEKTTIFKSALADTFEDPKMLEAMKKRDSIVKELVETEEDFARDMQYVVDNYYKQMENPRMPKELRDRKDSLFGNFKDICDFHNNVLMGGVQYHACEPTKLGKTFLRLERDFDMHTNYCRDEPHADLILTGELKEYFENHSKLLGDEKSLSDHLKLPIQRINDYQLLIKEIIKYSERLEEDVSDLQKALEFLHSITRKSADVKALNAMEGFRGSIQKLGRFLKKQDKFDVTYATNVTAERYVFLFPGRMFLTEIKSVGEKESYRLVDIVKLNEVDIVEEQQSIVIKHHNREIKEYPLRFQAKTVDQKNAWMKELTSPSALQAVDLGEEEQITVHEKPEIKEPEPKKAKVEPEPDRDLPKSIPSAKPETKLQSEPVKEDQPEPIITEPDSPALSTSQPKFQEELKTVEIKAVSESIEITTESESKKAKVDLETIKETNKKETKELKAETETKKAKTEGEFKKEKAETEVKKEKYEPEAEKIKPESGSKKEKSEQETKKEKTDKVDLKKDKLESETKKEKVEPESKVKSESETKEEKSEPELKKEPKETKKDKVEPEIKKEKPDTKLKVEPETKKEKPEPEVKKEKPEPEVKKEKTEPEVKKEKPEPEVKKEKTEPEVKKEKAEPEVKKVKQEPDLKKEEAEKESKKEKAEPEKKKNKTEQETQKSKVEPAPVPDTPESKPKKQKKAAEIESKEMDAAPSKPVFTKPLKGITCTQGENATFECEVESVPQATVKWLKNNQPVTKSNRIKTLSQGKNYSLSIKETCAEDGGLYTVMATNPTGNASCSAPLNLKASLLGVPKEDSRPTTPGGTVLPHAPVFKVKLKDTELLEGTSVRFELVVRGLPEPEVKFCKNDKELKQDDHVKVSFESKEVFELIIDHVTSKDAGTYTCIATNSEGQDITSGNITVTKHKILFQGLEDESEEERAPTPRPKKPIFKWFKDGKDFEASERFKVSFSEEEDTLGLLFQHVTPEDAGLYTCVASTSTGNKIACSAELTVQGVVREPKAPSIESKLEDVEVSEGASAMLELKISGYPKPQVTWLKDGKEIEIKPGGRYRLLFEDEENITLVIKNVTKADSGKYTVKIKNELGEANTSGKLTVTCPPSFSKKLQDMSVMTDEPVKFEVGVDGTPTPEIKWYKDGQQLSQSERIKMLHEADQIYALVINKAKTEDSGSYSCVLNNTCGSQAGFSNLVVNAPPTFVREMKNTEGTEGETISFSVKIAGNPKPTIKWLKNKDEVKVDGKHVKVVEEGDNVYNFVINKITTADCGKYSCEISNKYGSKTTSGNLGIKTKPNFTKQLSDKESKENEANLEFSVTVEGCPAPSIKWLHEGKEIKESSTYHIISNVDAGTYTLKLSKVAMDMSGKFTCEASNSLGKAQTSAVLSVQEDTSSHQAPKIVRHLSDQVAVVGDAARFEVQVTGIPTPKLKWFKDDKELSAGDKIIISSSTEDNTYTLTLKDLKLNDGGKFSFKAANTKGEVNESATLSVKEPVAPDIQGMGNVSVEEGSTAKFEVKVLGFPFPQVTWYKDGQQLKSGDNVVISSDNNTQKHVLTVKNAEEKNIGFYSIKASNVAGDVQKEGKFSFKGPAPEKPNFTQQIKPTKLIEGKPGKLEAKVSGVPKPKITWLKDGKEITPNNHFTIMEESDGTTTLLIDNVTPEDAGTYAIVAHSSQGDGKCEAAVSTIGGGKKPAFLTDLKNVNLSEGQPLKLEAKIEGMPVSVKWLKDGQEISPNNRLIISEEPDGTLSFSINEVTSQDAGKYTVMVNNAEGKARSTGLVEVKGAPKEKPKVLEGLQPATFVDGQPGKLSVKVSGEPKPTIKWLKDGQEISPNGRIQMAEEPDGTASLQISKVKPEDLGKYTVVVSNNNGENTSSAPVSVNQQPTFQRQLSQSTAINDCPAKIEAKLSGSPPPEIKWLKDGNEFMPDGVHVKSVSSPDGTVALLFDKCKPEDSGKYSCVAKNSLGEDTTVGGLSVKDKTCSDMPESAPQVLGPIGNVTLKEGETLVLEANISGNPIPDVEWILDGEPLKPSDIIHQIFDGQKAILEIKKCSPQHAGSYECRLSSPLGRASSQGAVSVEQNIPPKFIQPLTDIIAPVSRPLRLSCRVKGYPSPSIQWYYNGSLIVSGDKFKLQQDNDLCSLHLETPNLRDEGLYECRAKNIAGESASISSVSFSEKAEKEGAPVFLKRIGDAEVLEGMTAKFTACITGSPYPEVKWCKDGQPLEPSLRVKIDSETTGLLRLTLRDTELGDLGEYSVTVTNPLGTATCSARLYPDTLEEKYARKPIGDQYMDFDKFKKTGAPVPLSEKPFIIRMDDNFLTLAWKPSVPNSPRVPVTYQIEMSRYPEGEWTTYKSGIKDYLCDVLNLEPGQDYKFRIRVENKYGISEPSPYATAHRRKIQEPPPRKEPRIPVDFLPADYDIDHEPIEKYAEAPRFLRKEEDTMYGVLGQPVSIDFWLYGHPQPEVTWFFNGNKIEKGKYDFLQDRNGRVSTFIDKMSDEYVGSYMCHAVNDLGEASMKIRLDIAELPVFTHKLDETNIMAHRRGRMECNVKGVPYPSIKWYKDWHPLYDTDRIKLLWEEPDKCMFFLSGSMVRDGGLYSCVASNVAGSVSTSALLNVEESEDKYDIVTYNRPRSVKPRTKPFEDFYDIGDELGRGTQGINYHAVERANGKSYAAKTMIGKGKLRNFMNAEMDIMNQMCHSHLVNLWDAFDTKTSLTLITDLCGGGELLDNILKRGILTERQVAHYVKQVLEGLDYMHVKSIGHFGLTIGDLLVSRINSDTIKVGDFGLSAKVIGNIEYHLEYGHPEFVAPELANKESATLASDMWSVGVITYLLLSGVSPFLGENDRETLTQVQQGKINFIADAFVGVTDEAKDFMSKLLVFEPKGRMNVKTALQHPWLTQPYIERGEPLGNIERLKEYYKKWRNWHENASCKRFYRRRTMQSCFTHPSRMIYPPDEPYTPQSSPEPELDRSHIKPSEFDDVTFQQKINRETIDVRSESNYQNGPDTYLLQLRDTEFPLRVREYLRVGAHHSPTLAVNLQDSHWGDSTLVVKERRKFVDIMDEEIDDEQKGLATRTIPMRLHHEIGTLGYAHEQMELLKNEVWKDKDVGREREIGATPYFREKIKDIVIQEDQEASFRCHALGDPKPDYCWFRNDGILLETSRVVVTQLPGGQSELKLKPGKAYDVGIYKCVARNSLGITVCRARLKIGSPPGRPDAPEIRRKSDTEVYLTWTAPRYDGNSPIHCYHLEYKKPSETEWKTIAKNIEHQFFVLHDLTPSTAYQFRLTAMNKFGWGYPSLVTEQIDTLEEGAPKVKVSTARKFQQELTEQNTEFIPEDMEVTELDFSVEKNPVPIVESDPMELYRFVSEISRGRFSVIVKVWEKEKGSTLLAKVIHSEPETAASVRQEYDILKSLCHERIVKLESASFFGDKTILVMEKLSGVDILSYLTSFKEYSEETVSRIMRQVLDALEYLHYREICYVELQPDNVVMVDHRYPEIKLVDFGSAHFVPKTGKKITLKNAEIEYLAPEVVRQEPVTSATDIWGVGVLTYILLSGKSPFRGENDQETTENISFVRYRFDNLNKDVVTGEATRFLIQIFKNCQIKRPTVEECLENKWLLPSEFLIKRRESAIFSSQPLLEFSKQFHTKKLGATPLDLFSSLGMAFNRTISVDSGSDEL